MTIRNKLAPLIGVDIKDNDIAAAHKLHDSKKVKNCTIVKFLQRNKKEEVYENKIIWLERTQAICLRNRPLKQTLEIARST